MLVCLNFRWLRVFAWMVLYTLVCLDRCVTLCSNVPVPVILRVVLHSWKPVCLFFLSFLLAYLCVCVPACLQPNTSAFIICYSCCALIAGLNHYVDHYCGEEVKGCLYCSLRSVWKRQVRSSRFFEPMLVFYTCACTLMGLFSCMQVYISVLFVLVCVPVCLFTASVYTVSRIPVTDSMFYWVPAKLDGQFVRIVFVFLRSL